MIQYVESNRGDTLLRILFTLEGIMDDGSFVSIVLVILLIAIIVSLVLNVGKSKKIAEESEANIVRMVNSMPSDKRTPFMLQINSVKKNPTTAVLLALFLGGLGAHKFYLGKTGAGIIYILFCWTTIPAWIALFEAFGIAGTVAKYNEAKAAEYYRMYSQ